MDSVPEIYMLKLVLTLVDAFDTSLISHIQSFHTSKVSLVQIRSAM